MSRSNSIVEQKVGRGRRRYLKYVFLFCSLLIVACVYGYLRQPYGLQTGARQALELLAGNEGTLVTDVHLTQFDEQQLRWTLDAPSAQRGEGKQIVIHHPRLGFSEGGKENIVVTADQGDVDSATGRMVFTGRVEAKDDRTGRLLTEQLRFDPEKRMLYTDQAFRMESQKMLLEGQGLTLLQETQTLTVESHVKMTFPEGLSTTEQP